jgi:hypothetical protein
MRMRKVIIPPDLTSDEARRYLRDAMLDNVQEIASAAEKDGAHCDREVLLEITIESLPAETRQFLEGQVRRPNLSDYDAHSRPADRSPRDAM